MSALTIQANLRSAGSLRAGLVGVTKRLAPVNTVLSNLVAPLPAAISHELLE